MPKQSDPWPSFASRLSAISRLALWVLLLLSLTRLTLISLNHQAMNPVTSGLEYMKAFLTGIRFDLTIATIIAFPSILIAALGLWFGGDRGFPNGFRRSLVAMGWFFTITWLLLSVITLGYFREYHNQFDPHVLGVIHDDFGAVVQTIWKTYPVARGILVLLLILASFLWLLKKWLRRTYPFPPFPRANTWLTKTIYTICLISMIVIGARGSWGSRPMQRKDSACTIDPILNRCVANPFSALNYAIKAHLDLLDSDGLENYLDHNEVREAFHEFSGQTHLDSVDDAFLRVASGPTGGKPKHIILVLLESYDGWTMLPQHADWQISENMTRLAREGGSIPRFLPGSRSTMTSLASIISGMADAGVVTNERSHPDIEPYSTAIAPQMSDLGYETHFFYAGLGSWQRIQDFAHEQGFEHTHMGVDMTKSPGSNEWGVTDRDLYRHITSTLDSASTTFSVVMTASNHRPYSIDLKETGCEIPAPPPGYELFDDGNASLGMLGHHSYSDLCIGEFVDSFSKKHPDTFFALTADHWGRAFPSPRPTFLEQAIVPLILFQKGRSFPNLSKVGGSHYDLGATLIELAAPKGHPYHALGQNLLGPNPPETAVSRLWILGPDYIAPTLRDEGIQDLLGNSLNIKPAALESNQRRYNLLHGLSWWRLMEGKELPKE